MIRTKSRQSNAIVMLGGMALLALTGLGLSGCIILPIPTPSHGGEGVITKETIESFEPGKTTRADVLLRLGDPAERFQEERFFVYQWMRINGYLEIVTPFAGAETPFRHSCYLGLEFTPDNRVKRVKVLDPWFNFLELDDQHPQLQKWMAEERELPHP